jgi:predicted ester cyclase
MSDVTKAPKTVPDVARSFYESYNEHDLDSNWGTYISQALVNHAFGGAYDREAWLGVEQAYLSAFPDLHVEVLDQLAEGDKVASRVEMTGTQKEDFFGVPAAGAVGTLRVTFWDRVADEKIVEHWADADVGGLLQQLSGAAATLEGHVIVSAS